MFLTDHNSVSAFALELAEFLGSEQTQIMPAPRGGLIGTIRKTLQNKYRYEVHFFSNICKKGHSLSAVLKPVGFGQWFEPVELKHLSFCDAKERLAEVEKQISLNVLELSFGGVGFLRI